MSILQMSIQAGLLIIGIVIIRAIALNKLPKKTFLLLWGMALVRLLVPFDFSSKFSVFTLLNRLDNAVNTPQTPLPVNAGNIVPVAPATPEFVNGAGTFGDMALRQTIPFSLNPSIVVWLVGMALVLTFFAISYIRSYRELRFAILIRDNAFINKWLAEHKLKRNLLICQSDRITTPIAVGIIRPRIVLPKSMNLDDQQLLIYVLTHEYYHIRRLDAVWKLALITALCVHWFNPLVWAMMILLNRDLEITCDEMVVKYFGAVTKAAYAYSLIGMAEQRSKFSPMCIGFSKNATEERITAIMKIKRHSVIAVFISMMIVTGMATVFVTSATAQTINPLTSYSSTTLTADDYDKLLSLQFDGYQNMSILEYSKKVVDMLENYDGYSGLILQKMWQDTDFQKMRYTDENASFYFDTLMPIVYLSQGRYFGYPNSAYSTQGNGIVLKYTHLDEEQLTVGEYSQTMHGFMNDLYALLESNAVLDLQNDNNTNMAIRDEIERLKHNWESDVLQFDIEYGNYSIKPFGSPNNTN